MNHLLLSFFYEKIKYYLKWNTHLKLSAFFVVVYNSLIHYLNIDSIGDTIKEAKVRGIQGAMGV